MYIFIIVIIVDRDSKRSHLTLNNRWEVRRERNDTSRRSATSATFRVSARAERVLHSHRDRGATATTIDTGRI